jgi:hypothetical protein
MNPATVDCYCRITYQESRKVLASAAAVVSKWWVLGFMEKSISFVLCIAYGLESLGTAKYCVELGDAQLGTLWCPSNMLLCKVCSPRMTTISLTKVLNTVVFPLLLQISCSLFEQHAGWGSRRNPWVSFFPMFSLMIQNYTSTWFDHSCQASCPTPVTDWVRSSRVALYMGAGFTKLFW